MENGHLNASLNFLLSNVCDLGLYLIQQSSEFIINNKLMEVNLHQELERKTRLNIQAMKSKIRILSHFKDKIDHELFYQVFQQKEEEIKKQLRAEGAILDEKFDDLVKNMKNKNFNLLARINKIEKTMTDYYRDVGDQDEKDSISQDSDIPVPKRERKGPREPRKEKKITKQTRTNRNERKAVLSDIYEPSESQSPSEGELERKNFMAE